MNTPELSEGILVLAVALFVIAVLLFIAGFWADRHRDRRFNDYGIDRDARL